MAGGFPLGSTISQALTESPLAIAAPLARHTGGPIWNPREVVVLAVIGRPSENLPVWVWTLVTIGLPEIALGMVRIWKPSSVWSSKSHTVS
jgi:hypothetical protein